MSDDTAPNPNANPDALAGRLRDCAERLRHARHIEVDAQTALADLLADLAEALDPATAGSDAVAVAHLGESTAHLAEALHHHGPSHEPGVLAAARRRVEEAAAKAEAEAPIATGVVRQFIDVLGGMGV
jgi:hypothetical protein